MTIDDNDIDTPIYQYDGNDDNKKKFDLNKCKELLNRFKANNATEDEFWDFVLTYTEKTRGDYDKMIRTSRSNGGSTNQPFITILQHRCNAEPKSK